MRALLPQAVEITFVRSTASTATLDFALAPAGVRVFLRQHGGKLPTIDKYELEWCLVGMAGEEVDESKLADTDSLEWKVASSSLKMTRCTKSSLAPGCAYCFRSRGYSSEAGRWGPHGPATAPIRTLLPELPSDCSESLKVPSKVLAAQAEAAAEAAARTAAERAAREKAAVEELELQARTIALVHKTEDEVGGAATTAHQTPGAHTPRRMRIHACPHRACIHRWGASRSVRRPTYAASSLRLPTAASGGSLRAPRPNRSPRGPRCRAERRARTSTRARTRTRARCSQLPARSVRSAPLRSAVMAVHAACVHAAGAGGDEEGRVRGTR